MKFSISLLSNITYVVPQEIYCPNWYELLIMRAFNETTKILKRNFIPCQCFPSNFLSPVRLKKRCQWNCSLSCFSDFSPVWLLVAPEGARWSWIAESEGKGQIVLLPRCLPPFFSGVLLKYDNGAFSQGTVAFKIPAAVKCLFGFPLLLVTTWLCATSSGIFKRAVVFLLSSMIMSDLFCCRKF